MIVGDPPPELPVSGEDEDLGIVIALGDRRNRDPTTVARPCGPLDVLDPCGRDVARASPVGRGDEEAPKGRFVAAERPQVQQLPVPGDR